MKKLTIFTLILIMLIVMVVPALAAGGPHSDRGNVIGNGNPGIQVNRSPFSMAGTIAAIDPVARTVTVTMVCGNQLVKPYIGKEVTLQTNEATRFLLRNPEGNVTPITFEDLTVGQKVSSNGTLVDAIWTAFRITVGAQLICLP
jgi:hypothetical protein